MFLYFAILYFICLHSLLIWRINHFRHKMYRTKMGCFGHRDDGPNIHTFQNAKSVKARRMSQVRPCKYSWAKTHFTHTGEWVTALCTSRVWKTEDRPRMKRFHTHTHIHGDMKILWGQKYEQMICLAVRAQRLSSQLWQSNLCHN